MPDPRSQLSLLCVFVATRWVSYVGFQTLPLIIGALVVGLGLSTSAAGVLGGVELIALAVTAQLAAPYMSPSRLRRVGVLGAALAAAAQLATAAVPGGVVAIGCCRVVTGIGAGLLAASANASLAGMDQPERWFGRIGAVGSAAGTLLLGGLPFLTAFGGRKIVFVTLAATLLIAMVSARWLPVGVAAKREKAVPSAPTLADRSARLLIGGVALFSLGQGAIWSFVERLASSLGIAGAHLGGWFVAGAMVGIAASAAAGQVGARFGRTVPLVAGILVVAGACLALSLAGSEIVFGAMLLLFWAGLQFSFPLLFGLSAVLDNSGRLVTMSSNALLLLTSAATIVGGFIVARAGYKPMGWVTMLCCVVAAALIVPVTRGVDATVPARAASRG